MDRIQIQNTSLPHYRFLGIIKRATSYNTTALNEINNNAIDLTSGAITGNHIVTRNNFGKIHNDTHIFRQINCIPRSPIECITLDDEDNDNDTVNQHSNQSAQTVGQSIQSAGSSVQYDGPIAQFARQSLENIQSAGPSVQSGGPSAQSARQSLENIQSAGPSVQFAGQPLQYIQHNQARVNYIHQEPTYFPRLISPAASVALGGRRPIIIDGLNIGYAHGCNKKFSARGIYLCLQYFIKLGFQTVRILLPQHRQGAPGSETNSDINWLLANGYIFFTPSRKIDNLRLTCYSDRIILDHAYDCGGVVVSNDNFRDLYEESEKYKEIIENRQIMIMFIKDEVIVPSDQYSRQYPHLYLSNILHFPS